MALHQGYLETGHGALLVEIRSRRVNEIIQRAALPPPPLAIPSPVRVGGFFKSRCATCPKICWTKATHSPTTCGSCKKNGTIYCSICCDHGPLMPMGLCHDFCATCLGKYFSIKIDDGEVEKGTVACPFPGCDHPISVTVIEHLIKKNLLSAAHALRLKELKHADHRSYLQYVLSGEDPALTAWAMKNTQSCPECYTIVQKTSGCNHITCKCKVRASPLSHVPPNAPLVLVPEVLMLTITLCSRTSVSPCIATYRHAEGVLLRLWPQLQEAAFQPLMQEQRPSNPQPAGPRGRVHRVLAGRFFHHRHCQAASSQSLGSKRGATAAHYRRGTFLHRSHPHAPVPEL